MEEIEQTTWPRQQATRRWKPQFRQL